MLVARSEMKHPTGKLNDNHNRYQFQAPIEDWNAKVQLQDNAVLAIDHVLQTHGRTLPRIGYIFVGYDMYKGNPLSSAGVDPGFLTIPVYESAYSGRTTADVLSFVPDGVWARQTLSCEKLTKTKIFQSLSSYITELASYVGANINLFNFASAGMNAEINSKVSHLETKHDIIIQTTATCKVYNIALDPVNPPNLGKSFFEAVKSTSFSNASAVRMFVHMFGTHFVTDLSMGSRVGTEVIISRKTYQSIVGSGKKFEAHLQFGGFGVSGGVSGGHSESLSSSNDVNIVEEQRYSFSVGAPLPSTDTAGNAWGEMSMNSAEPLTYELAPLDRLPGLPHIYKLKVRGLLNIYNKFMREQKAELHRSEN